MRHTAYLSPSRYGIFYFRWPIPQRYHLSAKRTGVKVSLRTRCPHVAKALSRQLIAAGQTLTSQSTLAGMKYLAVRTDVHSHYKNMLERFKGKVAENGPFKGE